MGGSGTDNTFLVCYDYGQGGAWAFVRAPSEQSIHHTLRELVVVHDRPKWMTDDLWSRLVEDTVDLATPTGFLLQLLKESE